MWVPKSLRLQRLPGSLRLQRLPGSLQLFYVRVYECHDCRLPLVRSGECIGSNFKALDIDCPASCGLCGKIYDPANKDKDEL